MVVMGGPVHYIDLVNVVRETLNNTSKATERHDSKKPNLFQGKSKKEGNNRV
jgi:hypothetical protein